MIVKLGLAPGPAESCSSVLVTMPQTYTTPSNPEAGLKFRNYLYNHDLKSRNYNEITDEYDYVKKKFLHN